MAGYFPFHHAVVYLNTRLTNMSAVLRVPPRSSTAFPAACYHGYIDRSNRMPSLA